MSWPVFGDPCIKKVGSGFVFAGSRTKIVQPVPFSLMLMFTLVSGCAGVGPQMDGRGVSEGGGAPSPAISKTLTVAIEAEPLNLGLPFGDASGTLGGLQLRLAVHQRLATYDDRGESHPMLAEELPSQAKGSWLVRPDGTMQTTYRLRPNITWHDGTPHSGADFVLAWTVTRDPEVPTTHRTVSSQIREILTPDDRTLVLEWERTHPFAHAITEEDLGPLPAHLLEGIYRVDREQFLQSAYWTREFVGLGPYRLAEWEAGSHLTLRRYDGFYGARPKIDRLVFKFIPSTTTVVANLLAGAVDGAVPRAIDFEAAMVLKRDWEQSGRRPLVIVEPTHWTKLFAQFRDPTPRELLDVRVRRALLHAIDRQAMVESIFEGHSPVSHTFIPPGDIREDWVRDVAIRYSYDPQRALDLLGEVGWRRGPDGLVRTSGGDRAAVSLWGGRPGPLYERGVAIIGDYWKALGLDVNQMILTAAQVRDQRFASSFPSFSFNSIPLKFEFILRRVYGGACPLEATRWIGPSLGCYQNEEMDRTIDRLAVAIAPEDQRRLYRELVRIQTEELPVLPLFYEVRATVFREGVTGVKGDTKPFTSATWNVAEWDIQ